MYFEFWEIFFITNLFLPQCVKHTLEKKKKLKIQPARQLDTFRTLLWTTIIIIKKNQMSVELKQREDSHLETALQKKSCALDKDIWIFILITDWTKYRIWGNYFLRGFLLSEWSNSNLIMQFFHNCLWHSSQC